MTETPDQDVEFSALPAYLDVIVADVEGRLVILGAGDNPEDAMQALREQLEGSGSIPVHALYHSYAMVRGLDGPALRRLVSEDPAALSFYTLGRQDERLNASDEVRELADERVRRAALERVLTTVYDAIRQVLDHTEQVADPDNPTDEDVAVTRAVAAVLRQIGQSLRPAVQQIREVLPNVGVGDDDAEPGASPS